MGFKKKKSIKKFKIFKIYKKLEKQKAEKREKMIISGADLFYNAFFFRGFFF